jgi:hypothetical protein
VREEETLTKELRAAVEALTAKVARYKKECREQGVLRLSFSLFHNSSSMHTLLPAHQLYGSILIPIQRPFCLIALQSLKQHMSPILHNPTATEATVQRNLAAEKVLEAGRQADRADRAEGALRHVSTLLLRCMMHSVQSSRAQRSVLSRI